MTVSCQHFKPTLLGRKTSENDPSPHSARTTDTTVDEQKSISRETVASFVGRGRPHTSALTEHSVNTAHLPPTIWGLSKKTLQGSVAVCYLHGMVFCTICEDLYAGQSATMEPHSFWKPVLPVCPGHSANSEKQTLPLHVSLLPRDWNEIHRSHPASAPWRWDAGRERGQGPDKTKQAISILPWVLQMTSSASL